MATEAVPATPAQQAQAKVRTELRQRGLDAVVAMSPENITYAAATVPPSLRTVRSRLAACVIPADGAVELIVVNVDAALVQERAQVDRVIAYREFEQNPIDVLAESLRDRGLTGGRLGLETGYLPHRAFERLRTGLPNARLEPADDILSQVRMRKSPAEIEAIRSIGAAADRIARECVALVGPGDTELALAGLIEERYADAGGDQLDMLVVGSGPRSAHPNAPATDRQLQRGDVVRIDIIGTSANYYSDVARTATVGEPDDEQRRIHDLLFSVHQRTVEALRPGVAGADVFAIYDDAMRDAGLPAYHFVGHGLGITLHEEPYVNASNTHPLEEDMVLCIEPLTMLEGRFGMQVEDEVLITADGCELLTKADGLLRIGG